MPAPLGEGCAASSATIFGTLGDGTASGQGPQWPGRGVLATARPAPHNPGFAEAGELAALNEQKPPISDEARLGAELTLRGLRVFVAVEETGSIGGAAERIGGSASGVSQHITALEAAVGAKLFDRRSRPVTLTPAGHVLRSHAHRILEATADAHADLAELNLSGLPQLTLAIIDDLDASLTPTLVMSLQARFRNCFVNTFSGRSDWVTERLVSRQADIAVSAMLPDDTNAFRWTPILREPFVLVTARGLIAPGRDIRQQLDASPFVQYSEAMPIGRLVAQHMKRVRFSAPRRYAFEASRSVFAMVVQAGGWTLTTPLNILDADRFMGDVDILPMPFPSLTRRVYLIARSEELGSLPDWLAGECRRLLGEHVLPRFRAVAPDLADELDLAPD